MDNNLSYQQARRIRKTKFTDIFVDRLAQKDTGVLGAIGKSISLKSKARIEGIKERFDPLNIARFLTFGSKLGPALLGKFTGRNQRDIDYFTGRTRAIKGSYNTADKIKGVPGSDTEGINEQLAKIYSFLKTSREEDMKLKEMSKNYEEEIELEKKNRHKELLNTIKKLTNSISGGKTATSVKEEGPSIFDILMDKIRALGNLVSELKDTLVKIAEKIGTPIGRASGSAASQAGKLIGGALASSIGLASGVSAAFLIPFAMSAIEKEKIDENPYLPEYDNNPYALSVRKKREGGNLTEGQAASELQKKSIKKIPRSEIEQVVKSDMDDKIVQEEYGATKEKLQEWLRDPNHKVWQAPSNRTPNTLQRLGLEESTAGAGRGTAQLADYERQQLEAQGAPAAGVMKQNMKATPVTPTPKSSSVEPLSTTNTDLNLSQYFSSDKPGVSKTIVNNTTKQPTGPSLKPSQISVRNDEPTFMRLIEQSTRLV